MHQQQRQQRQQQEQPSSTQPFSASLLKRTRGTADSTPLPAEWIGATTKTFLTPLDGQDFISCQEQCYRGFYWERPEQLPTTIHTSFETTFNTLQDQGLFLYDAVQPGGKKLSHTFVTRTLIGKPGSTYRYLGLRLFSHPWGDISNQGDENNSQTSSLLHLGYSPTCATALITMGKLNQTLVQRTQQLLQHTVVPHVKGGLVGPADYSLTLVNRMEPTILKRDLKKERTYGMGKTSVSWHKDSGLMDFSSIAVYHTLTTTDGCDHDNNDDNNSNNNSNNNSESERPSQDWRVALRVATATKDTTTPPLVVPLPSGALYYLLDDFNHNHEHAVLAGKNQVRYSSTHRVAREGRGTWQYIREKCRTVLAQSKLVVSNKPDLVKVARAQQQLLTEIECEWLRQWYIQGSLHASLHFYWHSPIARLEQYYQELESHAAETLAMLQQASHGNNGTLASENLFDVFIETFEERSKARVIWEERLADPIFETMSKTTQPIQGTMVLCRGTHAFFDNLPLGIQELRSWRKRFVGVIKSNDKKGTLSKGLADLTKKEKRKVASNWEQMKADMMKTNKKSKTK